MPTVIGKNARNAASTHTDAHRGHSQPPTSNRPDHDTIWGARAMSGTVCDMITHGSRPRSAILNRAIRIASPMPTAAPSTSPPMARRSVYQAYPATAHQSGRELAAELSSSNSRVTMSHVCGIARSFVFGMMRAPKTFPPSAGPSAL